MAGKELKDCFAEVIDEFTINYLGLNVNHNLSITPKVHIIINHLKEYCVSTGLSLGSCTDQTVELVHQVVIQDSQIQSTTWNITKVKSMVKSFMKV